MRRVFGILSIVTALCLMFVLSPSLADDKPAAGDKKADAPKAAAKAAGPLCPVSGMPIKESFSTDYKGKKVYFCCDKCPAKFSENPDKFKDQVKAQWSAMIPLRMQVTCPGCGKPCSDKFTSTESGEAVNFCSADCKAKWDKGDQEMRKGLGKTYTFQTRCPMMDEQIDPKSSETVDGKTVYFCCDDCKGGFAKDKAAAMKKVDEQIKANQAAWIMKQAAKPAAGEKKEEKKEEKKDGGK
ncbi:YHS domain protein [Phycisphaerae bacterium RAS1]|nr:YHS domain protein [Phycisphaerae bacterium RAS1]